MGKKRVCSRKVNERKLASALKKCSKSHCHGFSGPVTRVLVEPRERVENGAFSNIRVAGKGNRFCVLSNFHLLLRSVFTGRSA